MSFASLEQRVNAAVISRLGNAEAVWTPADGGDSLTFPVIWDRRYAEVLDTSSRQPQIEFDDRDGPPGIARGDTIVVRPGSGSALGTYTVANVEPNGAGMTVVRLEAVA